MSHKLTERFERAIVYGTRLHTEQVRKGTEIPYISHLMAVASIVIENGGTEDEVIAAYLHDAAEDQGGQATLDIIGKEFGENVAKIVAGCTDAWVEPKPPWRKRKEQYIEHLQTEESGSVLLVSSADKLHNARAILSDYRKIGESLWDRFSGSKEGVLWYYRSLTDTYISKGVKPAIAEELDRVVTEIENLARG